MQSPCSGCSSGSLGVMVTRLGHVRCCFWLWKPDSKREGSPLSQIQACLSHVSFKTPCLGSGWCPNSVTERKENSKQLKSSPKITTLRTDKGNHFQQWLLLFICGIKMPVLWKCSVLDLIQELQHGCLQEEFPSHLMSLLYSLTWAAPVISAACCKSPIWCVCYLPASLSIY